jgi:hypothetical protein
MTRNHWFFTHLAGAAILTFIGLRLVMDRPLPQDVFVALGAGLGVALVLRLASRSASRPGLP